MTDDDRDRLYACWSRLLALETASQQIADSLGKITGSDDGRHAAAVVLHRLRAGAAEIANARAAAQLELDKDRAAKARGG